MQYNVFFSLQGDFKQKSTKQISHQNFKAKFPHFQSPFNQFQFSKVM